MGRRAKKFQKKLDARLDFKFDSDADLSLTKVDKVDVVATSIVTVLGNFASATFSAEAAGANTFSEADVHVLAVEGSLSSVDGVLVAGAASTTY